MNEKNVAQLSRRAVLAGGVAALGAIGLPLAAGSAPAASSPAAPSLVFCDGIFTAHFNSLLVGRRA